MPRSSASTIYRRRTLCDSLCLLILLLILLLTQGEDAR